jgi:hypothetical protein
MHAARLRLFAQLALLAPTVVGCGAATGLPDGTTSVADAGGGATGNGGDTGGGATSSGAFPMGTYTRCAEGVHNEDGNDFLDVVGFASGSVLTLVQSGETITAQYVDENGDARTYTFATTTITSATLAPSGQTASGFSGSCVQGPGDEGAFPAAMTATTGTLTYDDGAVFLTLDGSLQGDGGACGAESTHSSDWIVCDDRLGGVPSPEPTPPAVTAQLPGRPYACAAQIATYDDVEGEMEFVTSGGAGTLELAQGGTSVSARYTGESDLTAHLTFTATTATTALAGSGESVMTPCTVPIGAFGGGGPSPTPVALPIDAASIALDGETLFVSFTGTMDASSTCSGARVAVTLVCQAQ